MFGYITPEKPELKIKEYELFRAYYCGVCKSIGKKCGQLPRFALNYDSAFLAVLLSAAVNEPLELRAERCIAHPMKKRPCVKNSKIVVYAADMNIMLAYYNLYDNWRDEKSLLSGSASLILRTAFKKIKRKYHEKCGIIEDRLRELNELERNKCPSMDMAAEPFARLMEAVTFYNPADDGDVKKGEALKWIGYNLGKWIYIFDAFDDIAGDIKKGSYNPLIYQFGYAGGDIDEFRDGIRERVEFNLTHTLSEMAKAYKLLDIRNNSGIIENIIYMGMLRKTEQILKTGSCKKVEKSV